MLLVLVVALIGISTSAVIVRGMGDINPMAIALWRTAGAALLLSPAARAVSRRDFGWILLSGAFLAAHFTLWFASLDYTTVLRSTVMVATIPIWVGLAEWMGRSPPAGSFWLGTAAAVLGITCMSSGGEAEASLYGDFLALLGAWLAAAYMLIGRDVRQRVGIGTYACLVCAGAALTLLPVVVWSGVPMWGWDTQTWLLLAAAIAGPQLLGHNGFNYALGYLKASVVGTFSLLEPVGAALLALVFLDEWPSGLAVVGGGVTILGVLLANRRRA